MGVQFAAENASEAAVQDFFGHFGISLTTEHGIGTILEPAYFDTSSPGIYGASFIWYTEPVPELYFDTQLVTLNERRLNETGPHWIVREGQPIPEPSAAALFALGAIACTVVCQRRGG